MSIVLREVRGNVGLLTLNRPAKLNAWTGQMQSELYDGFQAFEADPAVSAIVVTGAGRGFCAGADLGGLNSLASGGGGGGAARAAPRAPAPEPETRSFLLPMYIQKPIIAAVCRGGPNSTLNRISHQCFYVCRLCAATNREDPAGQRRGGRDGLRVRPHLRHPVRQPGRQVVREVHAALHPGAI